MKRIPLLLDKLDRSAARIRKIYQNLDPEKGLVTFDQIKKIRGHYTLDENVKGWRLDLYDDDTVIVVCRFGVDSFLPIHWHDCYEEFLILDGIIMSDGKPIKAGEKIVYKPFQPHIVSSNDGAWAIIKFYGDIQKEEEGI